MELKNNTVYAHLYNDFNNILIKYKDHIGKLEEESNTSKELIINYEEKIKILQQENKSNEEKIIELEVENSLLKTKFIMLENEKSELLIINKELMYKINELDIKLAKTLVDTKLLKSNKKSNNFKILHINEEKIEDKNINSKMKRKLLRNSFNSFFIRNN